MRRRMSCDDTGVLRQMGPVRTATRRLWRVPRRLESDEHTQGGAFVRARCKGHDVFGECAHAQGLASLHRVLELQPLRRGEGLQREERLHQRPRARRGQGAFRRVRGELHRRCPRVREDRCLRRGREKARHEGLCAQAAVGPGRGRGLRHGNRGDRLAGDGAEHVAEAREHRPCRGDGERQAVRDDHRRRRDDRDHQGRRCRDRLFRPLGRLPGRGERG